MKKVLGRNVLLEVVDTKISNLAKAGVLISDNVDASGPKMMIAFMGEECKGIEVGDIVMVNPMGISPVAYQINGKKYYWTYDHAIVGIADETDEITALEARLTEKEDA